MAARPAGEATVPESRGRRLRGEAELSPAWPEEAPEPGRVRRAGFRVALQSGALAYRVTVDGKVQVLLVSKRRSKRWGIPKGKAEPHLSLAENAAKEAYEEAGVTGRVAPLAAGKFRTTKQGRFALAKIAIEVWVYLLEVTEQALDWPEKGLRRTRWVPCRKAAEMLDEPFLAELCRSLAVSRPS